MSSIDGGGRLLIIYTLSSRAKTSVVKGQGGGTCSWNPFMEPIEEEEEELRDEQQSPVKMEKEEGEGDGVGKRVNIEHTPFIYIPRAARKPKYCTLWGVKI